MNLSFLKEKKNKYIVWILLGVLVLVMALPMKNDTKSTLLSETETIEPKEVEERLKRVLSVMEGVGDVEVMVTTKNTESSLFSEERNLGEVQGVVIVAQGADEPTVNAKILEAVKALFGIDAHKISIIKMRPKEVGK